MGVLVQKQRSAKAAKRFFRKRLSGLRRTPRTLVTEKRSSYAAARTARMPGASHRRGGRLNNRAENAHEPTSERERRMRHFSSTRHAPRFLSMHAIVSKHFRRCRHPLRARRYREIMHRRFAEWRLITGAEAESATAAS